LETFALYTSPFCAACIGGQNFDSDRVVRYNFYLSHRSSHFASSSSFSIGLAEFFSPYIMISCQSLTPGSLENGNTGVQRIWGHGVAFSGSRTSLAVLIDFTADEFIPARKRFGKLRVLGWGIIILFFFFLFFVA
jgi:hypothetical protein